MKKFIFIFFISGLIFAQTNQSTIKRTGWITDKIDSLKSIQSRYINIIDYYPASLKATAGISTTVIENEAAFRAALGALNSAGGTIQFPQGDFAIDDSLTLYKDVVLVGAGMNKTFLRNDGSSFIVKKNLEVYDLSVEDCNGFGLESTATDTVIFERVSFRNVSYAVAASPDDRAINYIRISDCVIDSALLHGIYLPHAISGGLIENTNFSNIGNGTGSALGILLGLNDIDELVNNVIISNCKFDNMNGLAGLEVHAIQIYGDNNTIINPIIDGINGGSTLSHEHEAIYIKPYLGGNSIINPMIENGGNGAGAITVKRNATLSFLTYTIATQITGGFIKGSGSFNSAIYIEGSANITGTEIRMTGTSGGITGAGFDSSRVFVVDGVKINLVSGTGLYFSSVANSQIVNCNINTQSGYGIFFDASTRPLPGGSLAKNIDISHNKIRSTNRTIYAGSNIEDITIKNNSELRNSNDIQISLVFTGVCEVIGNGIMDNDSSTTEKTSQFAQIINNSTADSTSYLRFIFNNISTDGNVSTGLSMKAHRLNFDNNAFSTADSGYIGNAVRSQVFTNARFRTFRGNTFEDSVRTMYLFDADATQGDVIITDNTIRSTVSDARFSNCSSSVIANRWVMTNNTFNKAMNAFSSAAPTATEIWLENNPGGGQALNYRVSDGSPSGVLTPYHIGEQVLDTTNSLWYKATGTANTNWVEL